MEGNVAQNTTTYTSSVTLACVEQNCGEGSINTQRK